MKKLLLSSILGNVSEVLGIKKAREKIQKEELKGNTKHVRNRPDNTQEKEGMTENKGKNDEEELFRNLGKLFVGGLSHSTTSKELEAYFSRFGKLVDFVVIKDPESKKSRGFGFVTFFDAKNAETCLKVENHFLNGKKIDIRPFSYKEGLKVNKRNFGNRIYLGGLPFNLTEEDVKEFFSRYGVIEDILILSDKTTKKSKGFGFLTFKENDAAEKCKAERFVFLKGRLVHIKEADPRGHSKIKDWASTDSKSDGDIGLDIEKGIRDETRVGASSSGKKPPASEINQKTQKLFQDHFSGKFTPSKTMNENKTEGENKKDRFNESEVTEVEKMFGNFLINFTEGLETFGKDLIEFSSESEIEDVISNSDADVSGTDGEEDHDFSTPPGTVRKNLENASGGLNVRLAQVSVKRPTISKEENSKSKSLSFQSGNSLDFQKSMLKIKGFEGALVCSLCQWISPDNSCESFLTHLKTLAHRTKLKERFLLDKIRGEKPKTELLHINKPVQEKDLNFKSYSVKSQQSVLTNPNQRPKRRYPSSKHQSKILTGKEIIKSKAVEKGKQNIGQKPNQKTNEKKERIRVLKVNAAAKGWDSIQQISKNEIICEMCEKIIPTALNINNLIKNVSCHLQSKGHLQKLKMK